MVEWSMSWSKKYYTGLTNTQHNINDDWFKNVLRVLKDSGILFVPNLNKSFNKKGKEVSKKNIYIICFMLFIFFVFVIIFTF